MRTHDSALPQGQLLAARQFHLADARSPPRCSLDRHLATKELTVAESPDSTRKGPHSSSSNSKACWPAGRGAIAPPSEQLSSPEKGEPPRFLGRMVDIGKMWERRKTVPRPRHGRCNRHRESKAGAIRKFFRMQRFLQMGENTLHPITRLLEENEQSTPSVGGFWGRSYRGDATVP